MEIRNEILKNSVLPNQTTVLKFSMQWSPAVGRGDLHLQIATVMFVLYMHMI